MWMEERPVYNKNRHPWCEVKCRDFIHCQILILYSTVPDSYLYPAVLQYKGVLTRKSLLLVSHSHIGSFFNIVAWYNMLKLSWQVQRWCLDLILIPYVSRCARQCTMLEWSLDITFVPVSTAWACTLVSRINVLHSLFNFGQNSTLHDLIWNCTFINFWTFFQPAQDMIL